MSVIELRFTCGHTSKLTAAQTPNAPQCPDCGCAQIAHVKAPKPTFRGVATGPCCVENKS